MQEKIKAIGQWFAWYRKEILFGLLFFGVASISFALGYLANRSFNHTPIIIEKCSDNAVDSLQTHPQTSPQEN